MATATPHDGSNDDSKLEGKNSLADQALSSKDTPSSSTINENGDEKQPQSNPTTTDTNNTGATTAPAPSATDEPPSEKPKPVTPADKNYSSFSHSQKLFIAIMASWAAFFSPLSANIYYPVFNILAHDFHVSNTLINLTVTVYMVRKRHKVMCQGLLHGIAILFCLAISMGVF